MAFDLGLSCSLASFVITWARWSQEQAASPHPATVLGSAETHQVPIGFVAFVIYHVSALLSIDERSNIIFKWNIPE